MKINNLNENYSKIFQENNSSKVKNKNVQIGNQRFNQNNEQRNVKKKDKKINNVVNDMNKITEFLGRNIKFKLHKKTDTLMTQIIDVKTDEVIKEFPPEQLLDLEAKIEKAIGLIIDKKI